MTAQGRPPRPDRAEPLVTVLDRLTTEMRRIAGEATALDAALGAVLAGADARDPVLRAHLQSADLLRQSVEGVALFVAALRDGTEAGLSIDACDAARGLSLRAQADALAAPGARPASGLSAQRPGEAELWGP